MEIIVQLIFVIALFQYCVKAALSGNQWVIAGYGLSMGVIALASYPLVINQPTTILSELFNNKLVVENFALLTTAESIMGIMVSIYLLDNYFRTKRERTKWAKFLKIMPGIVALISIGYFELLFFKWRAGSEFLHTAILYSLIVTTGIVAMIYFVRYFIIGESLKLEISLILSLIIMALGLIVCSTVADYNISHAQSKLEWQPLIAITLCSFLFISVGYFLHKINFSSKIIAFIKWNK